MNSFRRLCHPSLFLIIILIFFPPSSNTLPEELSIGGLFSRDESEEQLIFSTAVEKINHNFNSTVFKPNVRFIDTLNAFEANTKGCSLLGEGVIALIGPFSWITSGQVQSICENYEIPHLEARLVTDFGPKTDLAINLYPHLSVLSKVLIDLIKAWEWKEFVILYEESHSIVHFTDFFTVISQNGWNVKIFQLLPDRPYRDVLWDIKELGFKNILVDILDDHILEVFRQAQQVGLITEQHNYLVNSLDMHTLDLENFRHSRTNITSLRIVREDHPILKEILQDWHSYSARHKLRGKSKVETPVFLKSRSAMIYDGIQILTMALKDLGEVEHQELHCGSRNSWGSGTSVINYIRQVQFAGFTGRVSFDNSGFRSNLTFEIVSISEEHMDVIAIWDNGNLTKTDYWQKHWRNVEELDLIKITTVLNDPFVMNTKNSKELRGNDRYEGFVPDMMKEIANLLNIRFEINLVKDGRYGAQVNETTNEWDGMIGEVLRGEADIAVADLTINSNREIAVDFTYPFMSTGISIIYKRPTTKETSLWSFLSPFSTVVWIYLITAFASISLVLFYIGRFTPYEWSNPHPCRHHEPVLENNCNARNSFWCTIGSLMQQGSDVAPKALSTRVICAIWYFFTLIVVSSYTANLAAFLTVEKIPFPFENVEELAAQAKIKYGCLGGGSTHKFFTNSKIPTYEKMGKMMGKWGNQVLVSSNAAGRIKVEKDDGKYAFFMESATIEYITERYCNLTQVGGLLDNKGYGVATKKGSKIRGPLSEAVLKLQETGILQQLKDKWWKQKGGGQCIAKPSAALTELDLKNLGGVFLVLVAGVFFSLLIGIFEFVVKTRVSAAGENFWSALWEELKFVGSCHKSTKVLKRKSVRSLSGGSRVLDNAQINDNGNMGNVNIINNPVFAPPPMAFTNNS